MNKNELKDLQEEIWLPVVGYEEYFHVSNMGKVKSIRQFKKGRRNRIMLGSLIDRYMRVSLRVGGKLSLKSIHRLVAEAFLPNPLNLPMVNHKDCDRTNNHVSNLEFCSASYNCKHAYDNGRTPWVKKQQQHCKGKIPPSAKIVLDNSTGIFYDTAKEAAIALGLKVTTVRSWLNGQRYNKTSLRYA